MPYAKRLIALLLSALVLTGALFGCAEEQGGEDAGFTMNACVCAPLESVDPAFCVDAETEPVFRALFENLLRTRLDEDGNRVLEPAVAKEYTAVQNFDGTVDYVFSLRSAARWSDGTRVKARDFVYAWRRLVDPATGSPNAAVLSMVSGYAEARETGDATRLAVTAENDATLRVTLDAPCAWFLSDVCTAVATMPLRSDAAGKYPDWATGANMPGCGAYCPSVWLKEQSLYLCRNDYYFDSHAAASNALRFVFAETAEQRAARYDSGEADYLLPAPGDAEGAQPLPLRQTICVLYNHVSDVFFSANVRSAFDLTLDRAAIAGALGGGQTAATGLVPHGVVNQPDDGRDFRDVGGDLLASDPEEYARRCAEARSEIHADGYWSGESFPEVTLLCPAGEGDCAAVARACERTWSKQLGVVVRVEEAERADFDARLAAGDYDLAVDSLAPAMGDALAWLAPYGGLDGANALHYVSKPYDLLLSVAETSRDLAARAAMLHDAEALLLEETALSPVVFGGRSELLRETVSGLRHNADGCPIFSSAAPTA